MAKQINWTPEAETTFEKVIAYLLENWTEKETRNFIASTFRVIDYISEHPFYVQENK